MEGYFGCRKWVFFRNIEITRFIPTSIKREMTNYTYKDKSGLRVCVEWYTHTDENRPRVKLLPMIHVADKAFYKEMSWERFACDVWLSEGFKGKTVTHGISSAMQIFAKFSRIGLAYQGSHPSNRSSSRTREVAFFPRTKTTPEEKVFEFGRDCSCGRCAPKKSVRVIRADLDSNDAQHLWRSMPLWVRWGWPFIIVGSSLTFHDNPGKIH